MNSEKIKYYISFIAFFLCISLHPGIAQEVQVRSVIESDTILIGDQVLFRIDVAQPLQAKISFPVFTDTIIDKIELINTIDRDTLEIDDEFIQVRQDYLITSFDSGFYEIPEQKLSYQSGDDMIDVLSDPAYLLVLTMPLDTAQAIFDIKMPYGEPITLAEILPYVLAALLALAIIFFLVRFIRKYRRKRKGIFPKKPDEPAHIVALRELDKLKGEKLWQNNRVKVYYTRITEILRIYLEGRFDVHALEQTSEEILEEVKKSGFNDNRLYTKLKEILTLSDLVKFAKMKPMPQDNETCLLDAYMFINETKPLDKLIEQDEDEGSSGEENVDESRPDKNLKENLSTSKIK